MREVNSRLALLFFLILTFAVQIAGWFFTNAGVFTWYPTLNKPAWNPPDWVFGPVWTVLYLMIAVAGWLLYVSPPSKERSAALCCYAVQLALNLAWSGFFFTLQSPLLGLLDISALWIFILLTIYFAWGVNQKAALLLIPYFLWVSYAVTLNTGIWYLN